jgi:hypothetical protein
MNHRIGPSSAGPEAHAVAGVGSHMRGAAGTPTA